MEREKKDPFLVGEPRSNTDDSLENYSFGPVKLETLEPFRTGTTDALAALGTLESPNALPLFAWPQAANIMDDMDQQEASALYGRIAAEQASSTVMAMPPSAPSLSVEQYYGAARADTGSSSDFPLPAGGGAVGLGLAPSALSLSLPRGDSDDSDNFSDMSSDRSAMTSPFLVREGSGNFLQLPGKRPSESALFNSMSYENLSARAAQMVPPEYYHDAAGLLATTVPRSASPQLIMMTSPLIRAIPSPSMSPSPSPALSPGGMSPLASQISMVDLDQQMNSFSPAEEALAQLIKLESSYAGSTSFDAGLSAVGQRPSSSELTVPKPRKRQSSASDRDEGPERPGRQARQTLYGCPYPNCGKSFTRPYNLKSHYRR